MEQRQQQRFPSPVGNTRCVTDHRTPLAVQWEAAADYVYNHNHRRNAQEGREKMLGGSNSCRSFPIGMGRKMTMVAHRYIETQQLLRPKCSAGRFDPNQLSMHQIIFNIISAYILVFFLSFSLSVSRCRFWRSRRDQTRRVTSRDYVLLIGLAREEDTKGVGKVLPFSFLFVISKRRAEVRGYRQHKQKKALK